ncbi:MAG: RES family NAD+ phosphorylase [Candidatus Eremiobacteraeota bacterium]|nr:RES family NAD+ phosphorylase [Candidatus Eremiobacteraeota bacterium]
MSEFLVREYDMRVHRLAFPQRSAATLTLVDDEDIPALDALLAAVNAVDRHRSGESRVFAPEDDYVGEHREYILAPFIHKCASRFSDGSFGILYASHELDTAIKEVVSRLTRYYEDGAAPPQETRKEHYTLRIVANDLVEVRASVVPGVDRRLYEATDYSASQSFGAHIRLTHSAVLYDSVRHSGGVCVGAFVPRICSDVQLGDLFDVVWDGARFSELKHVQHL